MTKTLLVGWDAACWDYLEPLLAAERLPVLAGLMARGPRGVLESTMPPWTPTAWSTIITGLAPGGHGIFDMQRRMPDGGQGPIHAGLRRGAPFWRYLNLAGIRTGLVNVPFSYPPDPVDGFMVCGFGTPGSVSRLTYPDELTDRVRARYPDFKPEVDPEILRTASPETIFRVEAAQQERFVEIAAGLLAERPVDVLVINLMFPDHANHKMPEMEQVQAAYEVTDRHLGRLIEAFAPDDIMLISDHGSSRLRGDFWLGAWLRDRGHIVERENDGRAQAASLNWLLLERAKDRGQRGLWERLVRRLHRAALLAGPSFLRKLMWDRLEADRPGVRAFIRWSGVVDPDRSPLIPGSVYAGLLYLNPLFAGEREAVLGAVRDGLADIIDPETGHPLFSAVHDGRRLYGGAADAPDLVLDAYDSAWNIRTGRYTSHPGPASAGYFYRHASHRDHGWHSRDGIFVFAGPSFAGARDGGRADLADIAATLLHTHGVPLPDNFDGDVIWPALSGALGRQAIVRQPALAVAPVSETPAYSEEEADALTEHLRSLGYLD